MKTVIGKYENFFILFYVLYLDVAIAFLVLYHSAAALSFSTNT